MELTQNFRKMSSGSQTRLKLTEIGPRMTLSLTKVESGYWGGETIFHKHFSRTAEEIAETERRIKARERLKAYVLKIYFTLVTLSVEKKKKKQ